MYCHLRIDNLHQSEFAKNISYTQSTREINNAETIYLHVSHGTIKPDPALSSGGSTKCSKTGQINHLF